MILTQVTAQHPGIGVDGLHAVIYGALCGGACGSLVLLIDPPAPNQDSAEGAMPVVRRPFIVRLFAVCGLLFFFIPPLAVPMSVAALRLTRGTAGWPRIVSWIAFFLTTIVIVLWVVILLLLNIMPARR